MASVCDRCGNKVSSGKIQSCFGVEVCPDCLKAIEKFAHTPVNQSTASKVLHGLAKVGKAVAENSGSGSGFKNPIGDR